MPQDRVPESSPAPALHERINRLFAVTPHLDALEREYRNREVVEACRAAGRELSESHLSELRRGVKTNPTLRVLQTIGWFFDVPVGYFTDADTAAQVERDLEVRETKLQAKRESERAARADLADAARELQQAIRSSGVTKMAHRSTSSGMDNRERALMMRALTQIILEDSADDEDD